MASGSARTSSNGSADEESAVGTGCHYLCPRGIFVSATLDNLHALSLIIASAHCSNALY